MWAVRKLFSSQPRSPSGQVRQNSPNSSEYSNQDIRLCGAGDPAASEELTEILLGTSNLADEVKDELMEGSESTNVLYEHQKKGSSQNIETYEDSQRPEPRVEANGDEAEEFGSRNLLYEHREIERGCGNTVCEGLEEWEGPVNEHSMQGYRPLEEPKMSRPPKVKAPRKKGVRNDKRVMQDFPAQELANGEVTKAVEANAITTNGGLLRRVEEEGIADRPLKAKRIKKVNGTAPRGKIARRSKPLVAVDDEAYDEEAHLGVNGAATANLLDSINLPKRQIKKLKSKVAESTAAELDFIIGPENPRGIDGEEDNTIPGEVSQIPSKLKKAKAKLPRLSSGVLAKSQEGDTDSEMPVHKPLTPAPYHSPRQNQHAVRSTLAVTATEATGVLTGAGNVEQGLESDEDPVRASKKAVGKRKAVDESSKDGPKRKRKRVNDKGAPNRDLRTMFSSISPSDRPSTAQNPINHANKASNTWAPINRQSNSRENSQEDDTGDFNFQPDREAPEESLSEASNNTALLKSSTSRKQRKRRLPIEVDEPGSSSTKPKTGSRQKSEGSRTNAPKTPKSKVTASEADAARTKGRLAAGDVTAIKEAVESYKAMNDMTQDQIIGVVQESALSKTSTSFWDDVCGEVPHISRRKVQDVCRRSFHNFEARGTWTTEQDDELRNAYERNPNKWKIIGQDINRFSEDARDRWRNYLVCGDNRQKDAWDKSEEIQLRIAVKDCIQAIREDKRIEIGDNPSVEDFESLLDWQKVSEKMNHTRSRLQCIYKWKKLKAIQQSDEEDSDGHAPISQTPWRIKEAQGQVRAFSVSDKLKLLRAIRDKEASKEAKIPWRVIGRELGERGKLMAWRLCFQKLKSMLPGHEDMKFRTIVEQLIGIFEASSPNEPEGFAALFKSSKKMVKSSTKTGKSKRNPEQIDNGDGANDTGNGAGPSTLTKKRRNIQVGMARQDKSTQETVQEADGAEDDGAVGNASGETPLVTKKKRKLRERMRRQDESTQETTDSANGHEGAGSDVETQMAAKFTRPIKPIARPRSFRKSNQKQYLSEERIVEEPSDNEDLPNGQIHQSGMGSELHTLIGCFEIAEVSNAVTDTEMNKAQNDETGYNNLDTADGVNNVTTNGFHNGDTESIDLDAADEAHNGATNGFHDDKSESFESNAADEDNTIIMNGFHERHETESIDLDTPTHKYLDQPQSEVDEIIASNPWGVDSDTDSESEDDSDLPARKTPRMESVEL